MVISADHRVPRTSRKVRAPTLRRPGFASARPGLAGMRPCPKSRRATRAKARAIAAAAMSAAAASGHQRWSGVPTNVSWPQPIGDSQTVQSSWALPTAAVRTAKPRAAKPRPLDVEAYPANWAATAVIAAKTMPMAV